MCIGFYHDYFVSARRVPVPDERFDYLCEYFKPARYSICIFVKKIVQLR